MARRKKPSPTRLSAGELEILQMLWEHGSVGLAEAQQLFGRPIGYTTVQTRLNRLAEKGLVERTSQRPARYRAAIAPADVTASYLDLLLERVSGGNVVPLVAHLMKERPLRRDEIAELKRLVAEAERQSRKNPPEDRS